MHGTSVRIIKFLVKLQNDDIQTLIFLSCGILGGRQSYFELFTVRLEPMLLNLVILDWNGM